MKLAQQATSTRRKVNSLSGMHRAQGQRSEMRSQSTARMGDGEEMFLYTVFRDKAVDVVEAVVAMEPAALVR